MRVARYITILIIILPRMGGGVESSDLNPVISPTNEGGQIHYNINNDNAKYGRRGGV